MKKGTSYKNALKLRPPILNRNSSRGVPGAYLPFHRPSENPHHSGGGTGSSKNGERSTWKILPRTPDTRNSRAALPISSRTQELLDRIRDGDATVRVAARSTSKYLTDLSMISQRMKYLVYKQGRYAKMFQRKRAEFNILSLFSSVSRPLCDEFPSFTLQYRFPSRLFHVIDVPDIRLCGTHLSILGTWFACKVCRKPSVSRTRRRIPEPRLSSLLD